MHNKPSHKRIGIVSQRFSEEENQATETKEAASQLLARFLQSVDSTSAKPPRTWESNPLYKELKRTLQGTIQMEEVEEFLKEKYESSIMSTYPSAQSTVTMSSSHSITLRDPELALSSSNTIESSEGSNPGWWNKKSSDLHCSSQNSKAFSRKSSISSESGSHHSGHSAKSGLDGLQGSWKLKWDEPVHLLDLCKLMELDKNDLDTRDDEVMLEINLLGHLFCVKSEIFALYNVEVPVNGEMTRIPRIDQHKGIMSALIETKRRGLRMIFTWDHPAAATRRDNYEVSSNGKKLTLTAYLIQREGHYCKVKWEFERA